MEPDEKPYIYTKRPTNKNETIDKLCQCQLCKTVTRHTLEFDFYVEPDDPEKKLYCERCLLLRHFEKPDCIEVILDPGQKINPGDTLRIDESEEDNYDDEDSADWWKQ